MISDLGSSPSSSRALLSPVRSSGEKRSSRFVYKLYLELKSENIYVHDVLWLSFLYDAENAAIAANSQWNTYKAMEKSSFHLSIYLPCSARIRLALGIPAQGEGTADCG